MVELYTRWIIRWRYLVVVLTVALVMLAGYGGRLLGFSNDYRMFFGADNPRLRAFDKMQNTYNKNDNILFVITPRSGKVFSVETLTAVKDITTEAWQIPYSIRVDSVSNFQHTYAEGDDLIVEDLVTDAGSGTELQRFVKGLVLLFGEQPGGGAYVQPAPVPHQRMHAAFQTRVLR